jgi:hypothetical protein
MFFMRGADGFDNMRLVHRQPSMLPIIVIAGARQTPGVEARQCRDECSCLDP